MKTPSQLSIGGWLLLSAIAAPVLANMLGLASERNEVAFGLSYIFLYVPACVCLGIAARKMGRSWLLYGVLAGATGFAGGAISYWFLKYSHVVVPDSGVASSEEIRKGTRMHNGRMFTAGVVLIAFASFGIVGTYQAAGLGAALSLAASFGVLFAFGFLVFRRAGEWRSANPSAHNQPVPFDAVVGVKDVLIFVVLSTFLGVSISVLSRWFGI